MPASHAFPRETRPERSKLSYRSTVSSIPACPRTRSSSRAMSAARHPDPASSAPLSASMPSPSEAERLSTRWTPLIPAAFTAAWAEAKVPDRAAERRTATTSFASARASRSTRTKSAGVG